MNILSHIAKNSIKISHIAGSFLARDVVQPPVFVNAALKRKYKKTCSHIIIVTWRPVALAGIKPGQTQNLCLVDCTKCRSTRLIRIWILAFCLCTTLFFLPYSVEPNLTLTMVVSLRSCLPGFARFRRPGDCMKISLSLFSIFCHP